MWFLHGCDVGAMSPVDLVSNLQQSCLWHAVSLFVAPFHFGGLAGIGSSPCSRRALFGLSIEHVSQTGYLARHSQGGWASGCSPDGGGVTGANASLSRGCGGGVVHSLRGY